VLKPLAEKIRGDFQNHGGIGTGEFHDFPEHVGEAVRPIEALEHAERASNLHFLNEERALRLGRRFQIQDAGEIFGEPFEVQVHPLHRALLHVEDEVHRDTVRPRLQLAAEVELRKARDDADEDLLRRVLGVFAVAQHAQGKAVDVALQRSDDFVECVSISIERPPGLVFQHDGR